MGKSGSLPGWQLCRGISGSFRVEWVAGFVWNQWQPWSGIRTHEGFLYLATVLDLFPRQIVAWSMKSRMSTDLVMDTMLMASWKRRPK
tara:strand:+ start:701 stop:964 length:264 start_codon:yes stop_codon:yes gene_type:complete